MKRILIVCCVLMSVAALLGVLILPKESQSQEVRIPVPDVASSVEPQPEEVTITLPEDASLEEPQLEGAEIVVPEAIAPEEPQAEETEVVVPEAIAPVEPQPEEAEIVVPEAIAPVEPQPEEAEIVVPEDIAPVEPQAEEAKIIVPQEPSPEESLLNNLELIVPEGVSSEDAKALIEGMFDHMRGLASFSVVEMTIHRSDWERTMTIEARTKGLSESIFFITGPPKDRGNGTLKKDREMWMFNPKVNRVIKLPPSMMSQAWMGSDFSNNDIAKSDTVINDYVHTLENTEIVDGLKVYTIKSIPKEGAPVVWGMQRAKVREDLIVLSQEFYDEDLELVKAMETMEIRQAGDRLFPMVWRMQKADAGGEYTQLEYKELEFLDDLPDNLFTLSNLKARRK